MRKTNHGKSENWRGFCAGEENAQKLDGALIYKTKKWMEFGIENVCKRKDCIAPGKKTDLGGYCLLHYLALSTCSVEGCLNAAALEKPFPTLCRKHFVIRDEKVNSEYKRCSRESIISSGSSTLAAMESYAVGNVREFPKKMVSKK